MTTENTPTTSQMILSAVGMPAAKESMLLYTGRCVTYAAANGITLAGFGDVMTEVLTAAFPSNRVGKRHGPHYVSLCRTGKLKDVEVAIPMASRKPRAATAAAATATVIEADDAPPAAAGDAPAAEAAAVDTNGKKRRGKKSEG